MTALSVNNLSKKYDLYDNARARVKEWLYFGHKKLHREFWALRGVSFDVPAGQVLGIIGRNGAGKSTLLKLITGVSTPTEGSVSVSGRVTALLELGAGFHPEFTGRDNIYMNSGLMGLDRSVVDRKLDQIIEFSELGEFIDLPVKLYSSGMAVRLGFSVAIHLDPELLIVDEALAVGDLRFQRKCINAMREFKKRGVTIILVTHSLGDVGAFCDRVILIEDGEVAMDDTTENVIEHYRNKMIGESETEVLASKRWNPLKAEIRTAEDTGQVRITGVTFLDLAGKKATKIKTGETMKVLISYDAREKVNNPLFRVMLFRNDGLFVTGTNTYRHELDLGEVYGKGEIELTFGSINLNSGLYYVTVSVAQDEYSSHVSERAFDTHDMAYTVEIESERRHGGGLVYCPSQWRKVT